MPSLLPRSPWRGKSKGPHQLRDLQTERYVSHYPSGVTGEGIGEQREQLHRNAQEGCSRHPHRVPAVPNRMLRTAEVVGFSFLLYSMNLQKWATQNLGCTKLRAGMGDFIYRPYCTLESKIHIPQRDNTIRNPNRWISEQGRTSIHWHHSSRPTLQDWEWSPKKRKTREFPLRLSHNKPN